MRKVKVYDKATSMVAVQEGKGVADNDTMVRIDVYFVPGDGYYWVPIYVCLLYTSPEGIDKLVDFMEQFRKEH